jgi:hydrogenase-4 component E
MFHDILITLSVLANFPLVATNRVHKAIQLAAFQGVLLGLLPLTLGLGWHTHPHIFLMAASIVAVKGWFIPFLLRRALREEKVHRDVKTNLGSTFSLLLCALGTGLALVLAHNLPLKPEATNGLFVPASLATLFTGFLMLVSRRKALTQVVGFLVLENGIYLFGLMLLEEMPLMVEAGVLLDLFVGIFVMGIVINHIQVAFDSIDTRKLTELKD